MIPHLLYHFTSTPASRFVIYFCYAATSLVTCFWLGRALDLARPIALLGGFLLVVLALPFFIGSSPQLSLTLRLNPYIAQSIALSSVMVACWWKMGARFDPVTSLLGLVPSLCLLFIVVAQAPQLALVIPATSVFGGASLLKTRRWQDNIPRFFSMIIVAVIALALLTYYRTISRYTAFSLFPSDFFQDRRQLVYASTFFNSQPIAKPAILLSFTGAFFASLNGSRAARIPAALYIAVFILSIIGGYAVVVLLPSYFGISPAYFELCLYPYLALYCANAIYVGMRWIANRLPSRFAPRSDCAIELYSPLFLSVLLLGGINSVTALRRHELTCTDPMFNPALPNVISNVLAEKAALLPGMPFRGLAATITGVGEKPVSWMDLFSHDQQLWFRKHIELRSIGLWQQNIPTLFQYSALLAPAYHLVLTDFLTRLKDRQIRNVVTLTKVNVPMMRLWGVRFLITDQSGNFGALLADMPGIGAETLRLLELPDPNLGNFSPSQVRYAATAVDTLRALHDPGFDGRSTVVTDDQKVGRASLTSATGVSMVLRKDGFALHASSAGRSTLVLPIQYSHCWTFASAHDARPFRANLMQLGVEFSGQLDSNLVFRFGPLLANSCRAQDLADMTQLQMSLARQDAAAATTPGHR